MGLFNDLTIMNQGLNGRVQGIQWGIVADTDDPLELDRIQVLDASKGGKSKSDWLVRVLPFPSISPPLPEIGDTVLISYVEGDPHNGTYLGIPQNNTNPNLHNRTDLVMKVGSTQVAITPEGAVTIDATDVTINAENVVFNTGDFAIAGASSVTINGKQVTTLGAADSDDGDVLVSKGW